MSIILVGLIITLVFYFLFYFYDLLRMKKYKKLNNYILLSFYIISFIIFIIGFVSNSKEYNIPLDPVDDGYTPLSIRHIFSFIVFFLLSNIALYKIWKFGNNHPPLLLVIYLSLIVMGIVLNIVLTIQLSNSYDQDYIYINNSRGYLMMITPILFIIFSIIKIYEVIIKQSIISNKQIFKNKLLNFLNSTIANSLNLPIWITLFILPLYLIITIILILFGQEYNSLTKVFTDTTTWYLSQKSHPPYLGHNGHYLCTVAACGSPKIVKPLRFGNRHGNIIIVNRQLLIANAFEEIIMNKFPKAHKIIRNFYDKYGYSLSKDINTSFKSNLIYIIMKPIEWIFLILIYLSSNNPEKLINKQYKI